MVSQFAHRAQLQGKSAGSFAIPGIAGESIFVESRRLWVGSRREFLGHAAYEIQQRQDSNSGTFGWCFGPVEAAEFRMYRPSRV